jgi:hypothetical protein
LFFLSTLTSSNIVFVLFFPNKNSYQVAIPPVASNAYGWSTVDISNLLAAQAIVLFLAMNGAMALSMTGVPDSAMIAGGNLFFVVGGVMTYFWWKVDAAPWQFVLPVMLISLAYPFMGPANRSRYTKAVHGYPGQLCRVSSYSFCRIVVECFHPVSSEEFIPRSRIGKLPWYHAIHLQPDVHDRRFSNT